MKKISYKIKDSAGLHARPASKLVQSLAKYSSSVKLEYNGKVANAKSIINLMSLGISGDSEVIFLIEGSDEEELSSSICSILSELGI
ncbi:hypothetical protein PVNG_02447 [Plasmodium vivax North Korean]|uniref:HPr domain-containing protein n=1 Tax=Plasmodium vivax North Korean TaxID=1035514 RepID=A0A0J9TLV9_PLAVI|nr:hypothetical protein PVNG_02447 [Plasmodium vivax North Korean]